MKSVKTSLESLMKEELSEEEITEIRRGAELEALAIRRAKEMASRFIIDLMSEQKLGFNEFSRKTGMSPSHLSAIIKGTSSPTLVTLVKIAALFHKNFDLKI